MEVEAPLFSLRAFGAESPNQPGTGLAKSKGGWEEPVPPAPPGCVSREASLRDPCWVCDLTAWESPVWVRPRDGEEGQPRPHVGASALIPSELGAVQPPGPSPRSHQRPPPPLDPGRA